MTAAVEIDQLSVRSPSLVLDALDLRVASGHIVAIAGRARSGKSTLMGAILGLVPRVGGDIRVNGLSLATHARAIRQHSTWIARCGVLEPHLTVRQNLAVILRLCGAARPDRAAVEGALRESDVPDRTFDLRAGLLLPPETLSVWLAIARLRRSSLVLLDDPTALLSPVESAPIAVRIRELRASGATVLVATRDSWLAQETADAIHVLEGGRLSLAQRPPHHGLVFEGPASP